MKPLNQRIVRIALCAVLLAGIVVTGYAGKATDIGESARREKPADGIVIIADEVPLANYAKQSSITKESADKLIKDIYQLTNNERTSRGLSTLVYDGKLASAAGVRAAELPTNWSHTRPNGQEWWTVDPEVMYGENLAKNYSNANDAVVAWMNSPSHAANILDGSFRTIGLAVYVDGNGVYYIAQEFGY